jgi:hypothetical protein
MHNGRCLSHCAIHWRHRGCHVRVRRNYHRRGVRLELTRRHGVLRLQLRLVVRVPLRHLLHLLVAVGRPIVLRVVVLRIGVVVDGRVRLGRHVMGVVLVLLPASLVVHGAIGRAMAAVRAWHHGREREAAMLPLQLVAGQKDQAANV